MAQSAPDYLTIALRTAATPEAIGNSLRTAVAGLIPVCQFTEFAQPATPWTRHWETFRCWKLVGAFAALGVVLRRDWNYGVISYTVVQRTASSEFVWRWARKVATCSGWYLRKGAVLILMGAVLGGAGAYAVARLLIAVVPSLPTRDPMTLAVTSFVLIMVALIACYLPARRATKVDPLVALRSE